MGGADLKLPGPAAFISIALVEGFAARSTDFQQKARLMAVKQIDFNTKCAEKTRRLIVTMPPRSLKSICSSVALPAYMLGRDPTKRIVCASYSDSLARKHANDCRILMKHPFYQQVFRATKISPIKDTEQEIATTSGGFRYATSVGGTLTGRGGNLIVIDDPIKPQDAMSEAARDEVRSWFGSTLLSRLDRKSEDAILLVMQRVHCEDLVGHLLDQGGWDHLDLPAIAEYEQTIQLSFGRCHVRTVGSVLHPDREPKSVLDDLKRDMGSQVFSAQYQQRPIPDGGNLIKWDWFKTYPHWTFEKNDRFIVSWDTAMTAKELSDYSVCVILHVRGEKVSVINVIRERLEFPDLRRRVIEVHQHWSGYPHYSLLIEDKGSGTSLIQDLKRSNIFANGIKPEGDKVMRMSGQTSRIEAGSVFLPESAFWLEDFKAEMLAFPYGRHDDQVDALSQALAYAWRRLAWWSYRRRDIFDFRKS